MGGGWQLKRKRRRWWGKGGTELELNRAMEHSARETKKEQEPTRGRISGGRVKGTVNVPYFKRARCFWNQWFLTFENFQLFEGLRGSNAV